MCECGVGALTHIVAVGTRYRVLDCGMPHCTGADMLMGADQLKLVFDFQRLKNVTKVVEINGVSRDTVRRWLNMLKMTDGVKTREGARRKPSRSTATIDKVTVWLGHTIRRPKTPTRKVKEQVASLRMSTKGF